PTDFASPGATARPAMRAARSRSVSSLPAMPSWPSRRMSAWLADPVSAFPAARASAGAAAPCALASARGRYTSMPISASRRRPWSSSMLVFLALDQVGMELEKDLVDRREQGIGHGQQAGVRCHDIGVVDLVDLGRSVGPVRAQAEHHAGQVTAVRGGHALEAQDFATDA